MGKIITSSSLKTQPWISLHPSILNKTANNQHLHHPRHTMVLPNLTNRILLRQSISLLPHPPTVISGAEIKCHLIMEDDVAIDIIKDVEERHKEELDIMHLEASEEAFNALPVRDTCDLPFSANGSPSLHHRAVDY